MRKLWEKIKKWLWENRPSDRTSSALDTDRSSPPKKVGVTRYPSTVDETYQRIKDE